MKAIMVLVDGMRPDAITDIPAAQKIIGESTACLAAKTVFPSVTLPCHVSLFHSVDPARHGTTTNVYAPQVRPVDGLFEVLNNLKIRCGFFYGWEQLRDISRPLSLTQSYYFSGKKNTWEKANSVISDTALCDIEKNSLDFAFVYFGWPDEAGHAEGWMSEEYRRALRGSWNEIKKLIDRYGDEYRFVILADHGGHDRTHGLDISEDMTIPIVFYGPEFPKGKKLEGLSIKDVAPTIAALFGAEIPEEWEGKNLLETL